MSRHRATTTEAALIRALKDFEDACTTAVELYRRRREARADWALLRAGRRVAVAAGVTFDDHPLGDLVYVDPCKITPADLARDKRVRAEGRASVLTPLISGAECAPGTPTGALVRAPVPVEPWNSAPESDPEQAAS